MVLTNSTLAPYPPELIERVADQAARDAHLTANLLDEAGLAPLPGGVRSFPAEFLLELGAAARLLAWESAGLELHRQAGLPAARDAIGMAFRDAARRLADPAAIAPGQPLSRAVFRLTLERLAWVGPRDLRAEILLDAPDEDALVEALARFLWDRRGAPPADDGSKAS